MAEEDLSSSGFGLVEVIIAMFLLAVVAVAILPALWHGIRYSSEQSTVATATRFLNSLVEEARDSGGCDAAGTIAGRTVDDGRGMTLTAAVSCTPGAANATDSMLISVMSGAKTLASTTALIYAP